MPKKKITHYGANAGKIQQTMDVTYSASVGQHIPDNNRKLPQIFAPVEKQVVSDPFFKQARQTRRTYIARPFFTIPYLSRDDAEITSLVATPRIHRQ